MTTRLCGAVLVACVLLGGCSGEGGAADADPPSTPDTTPVEPSVAAAPEVTGSPDEQYMARLRQALPELALDEDEYPAIGRGHCAELEQGFTLEEMAEATDQVVAEGGWD